MKLRNKRTGEIIETDFGLSVSVPDDEKLYGNDTYTQIKGYNSIKELSEEWEDVPEEPKEYWYIDCYGTAIRTLDNGNEWDERRKEIGNRFETEEEAEKAVEKLKTWRRLKDKGFRFLYWNDDYTIDFMINGQNTKRFKLDGLSRDLCIVFNTFGGE